MSSMISVWHTWTQVYTLLLKEAIQGLALHSFLVLLINLCGGESALIETLDTSRRITAIPPFCLCVPPFQPKATFFKWMRAGCLQFAVFVPTIAVIGLLFKMFALSRTTFDHIAELINLSVLVAMACLLQFYHLTSHLLAPFKPVRV